MAKSKQKFCGKGDLAIRPDAVGLTWPRAPGEDYWDPFVARRGVAVISVNGPLEHRGGWWFDSYEKLLSRVEGAMQDEDVHHIILDIDSPGGEVSGLQETVRRIRAMRKEYGKPIIAYADEEAYSAAYAIACAADEIYLPESGGVGSIGVLAEVCDRTAMTEAMGLRIEVVRSGSRKAEGHPDIPLSDATIARVQARVDGLAGQFFKLVKQARKGVSIDDLEGLQGQCVYGKRAVALGLADGVASFDEVFATYADEESFDNAASSTVSFTQPTDRSVESGEAMFDVLKKKLATAAAALASATTPAARKKAMAAYQAAAQALADARAKSKVKKSYKKKTVEEEEETDDGEPDDDDDDDDSDEEDDDAKKGGESKKSKKAEEEEEDEEEEKKMKKGKKAAASGGLLSFVKSLTGQTSAAGAKQVLASMHEQATAGAEALARVEALEASARESERNSLIQSMMAAGQLKPSQLDWAKTQSLKSLKSYRKATPAMFAPRVPTAKGPEVEASDADGLTSTERDIIAKTGITVKAFKAQRDIEQGVAAPKVN